MSKIKLLLDVVEDMRSLADSLQTIADSLQGNTPEQTTDAPKATEVSPSKPTAPKTPSIRYALCWLKRAARAKRRRSRRC